MPTRWGEESDGGGGVNSGSFKGGARVHLASDQAINNTEPSLTWGVEAYDVGDYWNPGAPTKFIVPPDKAGFHRVKVKINVNAIGGSRVQVILRRNGVNVEIGECYITTAVYPTTMAEARLELAAGDELDARAYSVNATVARSGSPGESSFEIEYLGPRP